VVSKRIPGVFKTRGNDHNTPPADKESGLVILPIDILFNVLDHLDPIDCIMLRYTCKALFSVVPVSEEHTAVGRPCGKTRLLARLIDSSLLPDLKSRDDSRLMSRSEIKSILRSESQCVLCDKFWPCDPTIHCPFHRQFAPKRKHTTALYLYYLSHPLQFLRAIGFRESISAERYQNAVERAASRTPTRRSKALEYGFINSWKEHVRLLEEVRENKSQPHPSSAVREIWSLHCCNHCMNVLPKNSYRHPCGYCDCRSCGWSTIEILRVVNNKAPCYLPHFIPLGYVSERKDRKAVRRIRRLKEGLKKKL